MSDRFDVAIVGAGMAGASLAAELAASCSVVMLEAEETPGYHATGRSAAFWSETYGGPEVQPLTHASGAFLREGGFLLPRAALHIGTKDQDGLVQGFIDRFEPLGVEIERVDPDRLRKLVPGLRAQWSCGVMEPTCCDIDVAALHQHYLALARADGAVLRTRSRLVAARRDGGRWALEYADGSTLTADLLVNAAGAWADEVAAMAGVKLIGIVPMRRTMAQLRVDPPPPDSLPLVLDIAEQFYFKPEAGRLWLSPHDETVSPPCDSAPEEIDVATAIDRLGRVIDWSVEHVEHRWAGLRSFAPDRLPVYGYDGTEEGFFWFAGQGGFGIQTAPAAARIAADLILDESISPVDAAPYAPTRFP